MSWLALPRRRLQNIAMGTLRNWIRMSYEFYDKLLEQL